MGKVKGSDKKTPAQGKPGAKLAAKPAVSKTADKTVATSAAKPAAKAAPKPAAKSVTLKMAKPAAAPTPPAATPAKTDLPKPAPVVIKPVPAPEKASIPAVASAPAAPSADAPAAEPKLVTSATPVVTGPEMKKKDLIDKVVKRSGVKKKDAKQVVEAMLAVLGEALFEGRELVLQPMGRLKTTRVKEAGNGRVLICRLRQGGGEGKGGKEALAEEDD